MPVDVATRKVTKKTIRKRAMPGAARKRLTPSKVARGLEAHETPLAPVATVASGDEE